MSKKLTAKQLKFIEEYLILGNGTQAAKNAGYSEKTAHSIASENLKKPEIQEEIQRRRDELREELQRQFVQDAKVARDVMMQILLDNESPANVRKDIAKDLLDRAGFKPVDKKDIHADVHQQVTFVEDLVDDD